MGFLRAWLAVIVLMDHIPPDSAWAPLNGALAIQGFYVLSGFFIQYVLLDHYNSALTSHGSLRNFYLSRLYRIFPSFLAVLLLSILFITIYHSAPRDGNTDYFRIWNHASFSHATYYFLSQVSIIGSSFTRFLSFSDASGEFYPMLLRIGGELHIPGAGSMLLVPQMWSLDIELMFYALAPFLLRLRDWWLVAVFAASLCARMFANYMGLYLFNFNNDFFPAEIGVFILGVLAARFYWRHIKNSEKRYDMYAWSGLSMLVIYSFAYRYWPILWITRNWLFLAAFAALLPFLMQASQKWSFDRWIGDLAYPMYLSHFLALGLAREFGLPLVSGAYGLTIALSIAMLLLIEKPVHRWRKKYFYKPVKFDENNSYELFEPDRNRITA